MDKVDIEILNCLQENAQTSLKSMSKKCYISPSAVSSHIKMLEVNGIIKGYQTQVDIKKLGFHVKSYIWVDVKPERKEEFYQLITAIPNILECDCITGNFSMLIKVVFKETEDLDNFISEYLHPFGDTKTQIAFSTPLPNRGLKMQINDC